MRILDWYILRKFNMMLVYGIAACIFLMVFVDMIGNLPDFIDKQIPALIIGKYYFLSVPYIVVLTLPVAALLSSFFSVGQLARHNELAAMRSAGIPVYRVVMPLLAYSIMISGLLFVFGEKVMPRSNQEKQDIQEEYMEGGKKTYQTRVSNVFWRDQAGRRVFIGSFDARQNLGRKISIQTLSGTQIVSRIDAKTMRWEDGTWTLENGYERVFSSENEEAKPFDRRVDKDLDFTPSDLLRLDVLPENMSYSELQHFIREIKRNGGDPKRWLTDLHFKVSIPFACFIMVLFGTPLASRKRKSGIIFGAIVSLIVCLIYYGFTKFIQTLGQTGTLDPLVAAWSTNAAFLVAGLFLMFAVRK